LVATVVGWGQEGHMAIAQVAATRLTPQATKAIQNYLGGKTLEQIAPLPDDYDHSASGKWSSALHYVNLPRDATAYDDKYCPATPGCVVSAIGQFHDMLVKEGTSGPTCEYGKSEEPCPIEFLVHFVGDAHQPLHVSYADDKGGNAVKVSWYGSQTNLHTVWDSKILQKYASQTDTLIQDLQDLISQNPNWVEHYATPSPPSYWANESFTYVLNNVYSYDSNDLGDAYYNASIGIVQQRLVAAAIRLSEMFNAIFA